jgi:hypothetical protein
MIQPRELESDQRRDVWATITPDGAANTEALRRLLQRNPEMRQTVRRLTILGERVGAAMGAIEMRSVRRAHCLKACLDGPKPRPQN